MRSTSPAIAFMLAVCFLSAPGGLFAQTLINVADRHDLVFDDTRDLLYITTDSGTVERYEPVTNTLLAPFNVGVDLAGGDITADGAFLYVGEETPGATQSIIRKVDLDTGTRTNLTYDQQSLEAGAWDVVIMANGNMVTTGRFAGSGDVPMREWDLVTETYTTIANVRQRTHMHRSHDREFFFALESNSSAGPISVFESASSSFIHSADTGGSLSSEVGGCSRNGDFLALGNSILNTDLSLFDVSTFTPGGQVFDPVDDIVYFADFNFDQILAIDFVNSSILFNIPIGEDIPASGSFPPTEMAVSGDARFIFLSTPSGVRVFRNPLVSDIVAPESFEAVNGTLVAGGPAELQESDNMDVSITRAPNDVQPRTTITAQTTTSVPMPSVIVLQVEGSVFARSDVNLTAELFDFDTGSWVELGTVTAARMTDSIEFFVAPFGDQSRFVEPGTQTIEARLRYVGTSPRMQFASNTDHITWIISP